MVALDLNLPVKHTGLLPVRLPVILGKLINKTLTTDIPNCKNVVLEK